MRFVARSTALMTSGVNGDGALATASSIAVTEIFESASTRINVDLTSDGDSPGRIRQLTTARASCGSALSACPPSSRVATQVVRNNALSWVDLDRRLSAARSSGFFETARISLAV